MKTLTLKESLMFLFHKRQKRLRTGITLLVACFVLFFALISQAIALQSKSDYLKLLERETSELSTASQSLKNDISEAEEPNRHNVSPHPLSISVLEINRQIQAIKSQLYDTRTFEATAYCNRGTTASGTTTRIGTVAADTRVLPFGSHLYIENYGKGIVEDRGGDIKGQRIDVWFDDCQDAYAWGRRNVKVTTVKF